MPRFHLWKSGCTKDPLPSEIAPALVVIAYWKGAVAASTALLSCWDIVRDTSLRRMSPATMPRTPPCNAVNPNESRHLLMGVPLLSPFALPSRTDCGCHATDPKVVLDVPWSCPTDLLQHRGGRNANWSRTHAHPTRTDCRGSGGRLRRSRIIKTMCQFALVDVANL